GTAAGEATRRAPASTRSRRTPPHGGGAASRAGGGPASDRRERPRGRVPDHGRPPAPARRTGVISPRRSSLASRSASRRSVLTRSAAARIRDGAATTQLIPAPAHARASPYPVGPASYTTRTGAGSVFSHATAASHPGGTRSDRTSPLPPSITPATTERACTSRPTQLPSFITGASRNSGSTAGPIPTA